MKYKYPRTFHLPWSLGISSDDKVANDLSIFENEIVVTKKMDGESFTGYNDSCHARSLDSKHHSSRDYVKSLHSTFKYLIPEDYRVCGENLFAKHSISYNDLESYLLIFSVWEKEKCFSWDFTIEFCKELNLFTVPVLFQGNWKDSPEKIHSFLESSLDYEKDEGYVIRNKGEFLYKDFSKNVLKFVRKNHVSTDEHWMSKEISQNSLKNR